jgi:hypothetical protein
VNLLSQWIDSVAMLKGGVLLRMQG